MYGNKNSYLIVTWKKWDIQHKTRQGIHCNKLNKTDTERKTSQGQHIQGTEQTEKKRRHAKIIKV